MVAAEITGSTPAQDLAPFGAARFDPTMTAAEVLADDGDAFGAAVESALIDRLTLTPAWVVFVLAALWFWSGANTSLATSIAVAARWLPAGQTLEARNVQGSVQGGGTIEWLRWQQGDLSVEVHDLQVHWSLRNLLDG